VDAAGQPSTPAAADTPTAAQSDWVPVSSEDDKGKAVIQRVSFDFQQQLFQQQLVQQQMV